MRCLPHDKPWRLRAALMAALAVVLVWQVTSRSIAAYLANASPKSALAIHPRQSTALMNRADEKLRTVDEDRPPEGVTGTIGSQDHEAAADPDYKEALAIRAMAEAALSENPLNAHALRILGQIADRSREAERAWHFMRTSARLSMNEGPALAWLIDKSFEKEDYAASLHYSDVLLRTKPQLINDVVPIFAKVAEDKTGRDALQRLLVSNPPWRMLFFRAFPLNALDARTPLELLLAVKGSPNPPTVDDLRSYLNALVEHKLYSLAYYAWLQFLSSDQLRSLGLVFNGSFETAPSGLPFDWMITPGAGVTIDLAPVPGQQGLSLEIAFQLGRVDFQGVTQLVVLTPGKYLVDGRYTGEVIGQRGMKWRVTCADGPVIGQSAIISGQTNTWKNIEFSFVVPPSGCPAQYLRLDLDARMSSEQFVSGTVWFDDLRIGRLEDVVHK